MMRSGVVLCLILVNVFSCLVNGWGLSSITGRDNSNFIVGSPRLSRGSMSYNEVHSVRKGLAELQEDAEPGSPDSLTQGAGDITPESDIHHQNGSVPFPHQNPPIALESHDHPRIEATIINPYRRAVLAAEIGGVVDRIHFKIGDLIEKDQTILEISRKRYTLAFRKAEQRLNALRSALRRAEEERAIKEKLVSMDASSIQELHKAEAEVDILRHRFQETRIGLEEAELDLEACQVKAPFTGYLAARYKEAHESVAPLEKLLLLVDSEKVYAVANVPERFSTYFEKGKKALFTQAAGKSFEGTVDLVEPVIEPKTDTRKVYVLIDNTQEELRIGMSGSLEPGK